MDRIITLHGPRRVLLALAIPLGLALVSGPAVSATKRPAAKNQDAKAAPAKPAAAPVAKGRLYAVVLGPGPAWKKQKPFKGPGLSQHRAYWQGLLADGRVASAGPLGEESGLALIRVRDQREANAVVAADPAVKARIFQGAARPYAAELISTPVLTGG